jgi:hypothetical protein
MEKNVKILLGLLLSPLLCRIKFLPTAQNNGEVNFKLHLQQAKWGKNLSINNQKY